MPRPARLARLRLAVAWLALAFTLPALLSVAARALFFQQPHWSESNHESTGLAPAPETTAEPVVQVYAARTWGNRGGVAVHTWIAAKRAGASGYVRFEVIGWRLRSGSALVIGPGTPDGQWFSNPPQLLADLRGAGVEAVIDKIEAVARNYPHSREYHTWPGPNSNTFVAHIARQVPELGVDLPPTAIGKDYLSGAVFAVAPSGTGYQLSLAGVVGVLAALREGLEVNLLGLVIGLRPWPLAVKLPGLGTWPSHPAVRRLEAGSAG